MCRIIKQCARLRGLKSRKANAHKLINQAKISIKDQIEIYDGWIGRNPPVLERFKNAFERYEQTSNIDPLMKKTVEYIKEKEYMKE